MSLKSFDPSSFRVTAPFLLSSLTSIFFTAPVSPSIPSTTFARVSAFWSRRSAEFTRAAINFGASTSFFGGMLLAEISGSTHTDRLQNHVVSLKSCHFNLYVQPLAVRSVFS